MLLEYISPISRLGTVRRQLSRLTHLRPALARLARSLALARHDVSSQLRDVLPTKVMKLPAPCGSALASGIAANLAALTLTLTAPTTLPTLSALASASLPAPAFADSRTIGEIAGSGLVFKDTLKIEAFDDPKVAGVQLYLSDFQRPVVEKLAKGDLFSDPSQGGLACGRSGKVVVSAAAARDTGGEEVFSEARSLLFKSLKVRRVVDRPGQTIIYAVYSQRLDTGEDSNKSRFKSNLCAVHVDEFE